MAHQDTKDVIDRQLDLCPARQQLCSSELTPVCKECGYFAIYCCEHQPCHHYRVIFTHGSCLHNGRATARSGLGLAMSVHPTTHKAIPVTNNHDLTGTRSLHRAELLAVRAGLQYLSDFCKWNKGHGKLHARGVHRTPNDTCFVIATDSPYVVKGITEWFPGWKARNWRTAKGTTPANLDLFLSLDAEVGACEANGTPVAFLLVPRVNNFIAVQLSEEAAALGDLAPNNPTPDDPTPDHSTADNSAADDHTPNHPTPEVSSTEVSSPEDLVLGELDLGEVASEGLACGKPAAERPASEQKAEDQR